MKFGTLVRIKKPQECYEKFKKLKDLGIQSCQLVYKPNSYIVEEALQIREAAEELGIEISAFFAGFLDSFTKWEIKYDYRNSGINSSAFGAERIRYVISAFPFVMALGVRDVIIHAGFIPSDPFASEYADMLCRIKLISDEAKSFGLNILFETGGETPITLLRTIETVSQLTAEIFS